MHKLKELLDSILNLILPKNNETAEIENISEADIVNIVPIALEMKDSRFKAMFQYKNKITRKAVWAIKYNKNKKITEKFSNLLYEFILENISDEMIFSKFDNPLLIPIPMHKNNLRERGYNQAELLAKEILKNDGGKNFDISINALIKIKETPHQSALKNRSDRLKNLKDSFRADEKLVKNRNIILIDDVITTGTTMSEASKTLKNAGAKKVIGFALAH